MRIHDSLFGGILILVAAAMWLASDGLPNPSMQPYGPGFFPKILATLLFGTCALLVATRTGASTPIVSIDRWAKEPRTLVRVLLVPVGIILFVVFIRSVGFIPGAVALLVAMFLADEVPPIRALLTSVIVVLAVHSVFYLGLRVQLPWGLLQPVRW